MDHVIEVFKYTDEDDEGEFITNAFECTHCGETTDIVDDFVWRNGRWETRNTVDCDHCDELGSIIAYKLEL